MRKKAIGGDIIFTKNQEEFEILEQGYLLVEDDQILGVSQRLEKDASYDLIDHRDKLIIPGFVDLHIHAPQINNLGLGSDQELLQWLSSYTFPEEELFKDLYYAKEAYTRFINKLWKNGTTSSVIFGSIHKDSTLLLMDLLEHSGLSAYVGKVNMDLNSPDYYQESTSTALSQTQEFIESALKRYKRIQPIITPRFVPTSTEELMRGLGKMAEEYQLKVHSHLSENRDEIQWVKALHPDCPTYAHVYDKFGLLKENLQTIMAHCVWPDEREISLLSEKQVMVAHSPFSNANLSSGISPVSTLLSRGVPVGLASDISGGHEIFMGRILTQAGILAKMRWIYLNEGAPRLTDEQLFYMATKGGGRFFGKVGSFEPGYKADFLVINDKDLEDCHPRSIRQRLQRFLTIGDDRQIHERYVRGSLLEKPF